MNRPLHRVGIALMIGALVALGVGGGLWLGTPASAAPSETIQVQMAGDTEFSSVASGPLLSLADLVPGGSVTGTMQVRDASGNGSAESTTDSITLRMTDTRMTDECTDVSSTCAGAGKALAKALQFTLAVTPTRADIPTVTTHPTFESLQQGVALAAALHDGDQFSVTLSAALPASTSNAVEFGVVAFNLQLELLSVAGESAQQGDNSPTQSGAQSAAPTHKPDVLVLDKNDKQLSYTGVPTLALATAGTLLLVGGLSLLAISRRRETV